MRGAPWRPEAHARPAPPAPRQAHERDAAGRPSPCTVGRFGAEQAERLLWRAGFGPRPGEAEKLARKGLDGAVHSLTRPRRKERLGGPAAQGRGRPPAGAVRTPTATTSSGGWTGWSARNRPLTERMTLVWHDWFATSNDEVGVPAPDDPPEQAAAEERARVVPRTAACGSRATRRCCSGSRAPEARRTRRTRTTRRELMELFTLGVGRGYTRGRRARAGARADRLPQRLGRRRRARTTSASTASTTTTASSASSARRAASTGVTPARSASSTRATRRSSCEKLWSYFIPTPPRPQTRRGAERLYVRGRLRGAAGGRGDPAPPRPSTGARAW